MRRPRTSTDAVPAPNNLLVILFKSCLNRPACHQHPLLRHHHPVRGPLSSIDATPSQVALSWLTLLQASRRR
jgi:hypothetical protein